MFTIAVQQFVDSCGKASLHPVPDINSASDYMPLHVIVKKDSIFSCCCGSKIVRSPYKIDDLLDQPCDAKLRSKDLVTFTDPLTTTVKANSSIGTEITTHFDADLQGSKTFITAASLGTIVKADIQDLGKVLNKICNAKVNKNNELVVRTIGRKHLSLGMIVESASTSSVGELTQTDNWAVVGHNKENILNSYVTASTDIQNNNTRKFEIPSGTALAYSFVDLIILPSGSIRIGTHFGHTFDAGNAADNAFELSVF